MAREVMIKAKFFNNDCTVISFGKVIANGLGYEDAIKKATENGGIVWQKFMDEDGSMGMICKCFDCSKED